MHSGYQQSHPSHQVAVFFLFLFSFRIIYKYADWDLLSARCPALIALCRTAIAKSFPENTKQQDVQPMKLRKKAQSVILLHQNTISLADIISDSRVLLPSSIQKRQAMMKCCLKTLGCLLTVSQICFINHYKTFNSSWNWTFLLCTVSTRAQLPKFSSCLVDFFQYQQLIWWPSGCCWNPISSSGQLFDVAQHHLEIPSLVLKKWNTLNTLSFTF